MNILHIAVTMKVGGGSEYLYSLIKECLQKDPKIRISVVAPQDGAYFDLLSSLGVTMYNLPVRDTSFATLIALWKIVRSQNIHIIHSQGKGAGIYGRVLGTILRKKVIHSFHGFHFSHFSYLKQKIYLFSEQLLSLATSSYLCVSEDEKQKVIQYKACLNTTKLHVVYNGIDPKRIEKPFISKKELGFESEDILITTIARVTPQKGILDFINAAHIVTRQLPNAKFLIVGDVAKDEVLLDYEQSYRTEVLNRIKSLRLDNNIVIIPKTPYAIDYLHSSDVFVSASWGEGFSLSLLEAMLLAKPIVVTDVTGNSEAIDHQINGLKVPKQDPENLATAILQLQHSPDTGSNYGENAKIKVIQNYSFDQMVTQTLHVYQKVLQ